MPKTSLASQPEDTPPARHSHLSLAIFLVLGFTAGLAVGYFTWGNTPAAAQTVPDSQEAVASKRYDVPVGTDPIWGPVNAPVTIIEFSDYECPYCHKWYTEIWPQIQQAYPDQIRLVYKDFPLTQSHPNASPAASAARCANDQGMYWQFHDQLFRASTLSLQTYQAVAANLGMDVTQWQNCFDSNKYNADIEADYNYGAQLGITGTPTFFINGIPLVGAQPFSAFKSVIDQELAAVK